jgi:PAS domain S-box-containing protein
MSLRRPLRWRARAEHRAELALREAQRLTPTELDSISDAFAAVDHRWRLTCVNELALRCIGGKTGDGLTQEHALGRDVWQLLPDAVGTELYRHCHGAMREQQAVEFETYFHPRGQWIEGRIHPSEDGLSMYYRDVSDRKRAEQQLAYDAQLLENMDDAVLATDAEFALTAWNRGAERMFGWTADEALGRLVHELIPTSFSDAELAAEMRELVDTGRWRGEAIWYGKHATPVYAEALTIALSSDQPEVTGYLCIMRDVAERRRARQDLQASARQQALVAELSLRALGGSGSVQKLLDDAVALVARTLEVEMASVAELLPSGEALNWRAAFGLDGDAIRDAPPSLASPGSLVGYTLAAGVPVVSEDVNADARFDVSRLFARHTVSAAAVVIPGPREPFGVLAAAASKPRQFPSDDVNFMRSVANVLGIAVERSRSEDRLEEAREAERRRIARDLHDEALGAVSDAVAQASVAGAASTAAPDEDAWPALIEALTRVSQRLRSSIYDLRLTSMEDRRFGDLLAELVAIQATMADDCDVLLRGREALPAGSLGHRGTEVLRILREAIANARRHSGAKTICVDARGSSRAALHLEVGDDGIWSDRALARSPVLGTGIVGMRERAEILGGDLRVEQRLRGGTLVSLDLALGAPADSGDG